MYKRKKANDIMEQIQRDLEQQMFGDDIYSIQSAIESFENDEITAAELGFMDGYLAA